MILARYWSKNSCAMGIISIVATLDLEEMSGGLSRWVRRGSSGTFSPQNVA